MKIRTTLHLDAKTAQKLDKEAAARGLTRTQFVIMLAHQIMPRYKKHAFTFKTTQYQKRQNDVEWKIVHIKPDEMNYCFMVEMRCLYKFSVSALIARALHEYLADQTKKSNALKKSPYMDNYCYNGRLIMNNKSNTFICWKLYWNIPTKPQKIFSI